MRLCVGVSLSHWWVGSLFEADPCSLIWIQARLPSWVPDVTGSHPEKIFFSPGIHLFNQFFAAWSSIYSRMVEFQLRKRWSTLKAAVALKALRFWYPDLEIFKYIFWDQTGDISGNIQEA